MGITTTENYDIANAQNNKEPVLVLEIEGVPFVLGSETISTTIRYDDPGVYYDGTYVYDGLRPLDPDKQKKLIDRKGSSSTISQKLEQWDGKASVETFNIRIVDYQKIVTNVCSPGNVIEDIVNRKVRVFYGFKNISYPEDYALIFKGYINNVNISQGAVSFTFTDPSSKRKQVLFNGSTSSLTTAVSNVDTTFTLSSTENLYRTITNAVGYDDPTVNIGLLIDGKEIVTYANADIISGTQVNVNRGQFGTTQVAHDANVEVKMFLFLNDNVVNIALKTMLSGWNGPYIESLKLRGIINTDDGFTVPNSVTFEQGVDVTRDYGVTAGDFMLLSGSPFGTNNGTFLVSDIINNGRTVLVSSSSFTQENPSPGDIPTVAAFRSKYDVYPVTAGLGLTPDDVLVSQHEYIRQVFLKYTMQFKIIGQEKSGKQWIEENLFKPSGAYSLTQGSRISMGVTHPPLSTDLTKFIGPSNVVSAKDIIVERGLNSRFFYNEVLFQYAYDPIANEFKRSFRVIDADAQARTRQVSVLQLDCKGLPDDPASVTTMQQRAARILLRYKYAAETIELRTFFGTGHTIDAGDIVVLTDTDPPTLQIANTETGGRGIVGRVMEVQERSIDISQGQTKLKLLSNNGFSLTDRYGVISGASFVDSIYPNTNSVFKIKDSFGAIFPGAEYKKWSEYQGSMVRVHDQSYANDAEATFTLDASNPYLVHVSPSLPFVPGAGYVMEFAKYDDSSSSVAAAIKSQFVFLDPTATIFSASSPAVFVLDSGYSSRYQAGMTIYVMSPDGSRYSPDVKIMSVVGDVVTVGPVLTGGANADLGFTPSSGDLVQLAGFKDNGPGYRLI